jgi:hypothetical protein
LERVCGAGLPVTPLLKQLADQDQQAWRYLADSLRAAHGAVLGAAWPRLRAGFDADLLWRGQVQRQEGLRGMLAGLHPGGRWRGSTLEVPIAKELDVHLHGEGLLCSPPPAGPDGRLSAATRRGRCWSTRRSRRCRT